jgi:hypothetical protein
VRRGFGIVGAEVVLVISVEKLGVDTQTGGGLCYRKSDDAADCDCLQLACSNVIPDCHFAALHKCCDLGRSGKHWRRLRFGFRFHRRQKAAAFHSEQADIFCDK